jgi:hypothetical protein
MSDDREKPGVVFWATVVMVAALVVYPLSFGPACWGMDRGIGDSCEIAAVFRPILWLWVSGPQWVGESVSWYANLFARNRDWGVEPVELVFMRVRRVSWD